MASQNRIIRSDHKPPDMSRTDLRVSRMTRVLHRSGAIPPIAVSGEGIYLHTADGRTIIDASGGAAVAAIGHGNRRVAEAIGRQAAAMAYAHTGTFSNQPA